MLFAYPSYEAAIEAHERVLRKSGGQTGMISPSNLKYVLESLEDVGKGFSSAAAAKRKAAYLLDNIIRLHPFLDGNKRTAFAITKVFLDINGWAFEPSEQEAFEHLLTIARGEMSQAQIETWIGTHLRMREVRK